MKLLRWNIDLQTDDWQSANAYKQALDFLAAGKPIAVPTETVYGLAADATNGYACAQIFKVKGRPKFNPLISHFANFEAAESHGHFDANSTKLANAFWPGPLTLVVPKREGSKISSLCSAGLDTVAIRVPDAPVMQALARDSNRPLAAPSANSSGRISPTTGQDVIEDLGSRISMLIDAGRTRVGLESTVVACVDGSVTLLRPGGIPSSEIESVTGLPLLRQVKNESSPMSPGMLSSHYAPSAPVRTNAAEVEPDEALLAFGAELPAGAENCLRTFNLSESADPVEAASRLFEGLRMLDSLQPKKIAVMPIPHGGIGEAINDRLDRAAAPRN